MDTNWIGNELEFSSGVLEDLPPDFDTDDEDDETLESGSLSDNEISSSAAKTADAEAGNMDRLKGTASLVITKKEKPPERSSRKSVAGISTKEAGNVSRLQITDTKLPSSVMQKDPNKCDSSFNFKKKSNESMMSFSNELSCVFDEELPPSSDTIDSRISKNSIKTNNSKGMPMAIIKDDTIMIENKKTLKKKVSFKKMATKVQMGNKFKTQDQKFEELYGSITIDERMTEKENAYSSVFHEVMQEKDNNIHIDERKNTNLGLCNNDLPNEEEKRKLRIAFYIIVAIYILALFCNIKFVNNLDNTKDASSISSNNDNRNTNAGDTDEIKLSGDNDNSYIENVFELIGTRRYRRSYLSG